MGRKVKINMELKMMLKMKINTKMEMKIRRKVEGGRCKPAIRIAAVAGRSASEREKRKLWCCLLMAGDDLRTVGDDMRF